MHAGKSRIPITFPEYSDIAIGLQSGNEWTVIKLSRGQSSRKGITMDNLRLKRECKRAGLTPEIETEHRLFQMLFQNRERVRGRCCAAP
jgi:hypothetical protein